jgi:hypothetical protein
MAETTRPENRLAFPTHAEPGMTLRDYFSAHVPEVSNEWIEMQAEQDRIRNPHGDDYKPARRSVMEIRAAWRYEYADAMLRERAKAQE